jgi:RHS repeat-associated protein
MKIRSILLPGGVLLIALFGHGLRTQADIILRLDIARTNSNVVLTWTNADAALESSPVLPGAWSELTGAVSPQVISPTNLASFFRLRATNTPVSFAYLYVAPTFSSSIGDPFGCGCVSPENPNTLGAVGGAQDNGLGSVLLQTGELTQDAVVVEIPGRGFNWRCEFSYRSGMSYDGPMGQGWDFNYNRRLAVDTNGNVRAINGLGRVDPYTWTTNLTFTVPAGFFTQLKRNLDGTFTERDRHGTTNFYFATNTLGIAQLSRLSDRNSNQMTFQYNTASQLTNVVDTLGRSIAYGYDANGRLTTVSDFAGRTSHFAYDSNGDLVSTTSPAVTGTPNGNDFPSGKTTLCTYTSGYADPRFNHKLLTVTAPNEAAVSGPPRLKAQYDLNPSSTNAARLVSLTLGGTNGTGIAAGGTISYTYTSFGPAGGADYTTPVFQNIVTNRHGHVTQYRFNQLGNIVSKVQYTSGIRVGDPVAYTNVFAYNADGEMIAQTNAELSSVQYTYDSANPNRLAQGNLLQTLSLPGPRNGDQAQIAVINSYETSFNFIATTTDGRSNTLSFRYDSRGNKTNIVHRLTSMVEDFAYNASGQMTSHTLPDNGSGSRRRDTMAYYSGGSQQGYLQQSVVDSGGFNLTNSYAYDLAGNVTNAIDARGSNTMFTVNSLNQVVRTFSPTVTTTNGPVRYQQSFYYDANNNVIRTDVQNIDDGGNLVAFLPNFTTTNVFDILNAPLATTLRVNGVEYLGNELRYDANGNRILTRSGVATSGLQPNNVVSLTFDDVDLVYQEILAPNDPDQSTTEFDYDGDGNLVSRSQGTESDPGITTYAYDGYDRPTTSTDAMGNVTILNYDPNGNVTRNRVDGELVDVPGSAGNVRLSETAYTYDAEDRRTVSDAAFFDPTTQTDIGTGHAITSIAYSANSQVTTNIDADMNVTVTLYDTACRASVVTDPKNNTVTYTYDANHNVIKTAEVDLSDLGSPAQTIQTTNTYDSLNRLVQTVDQLGNTNRYAYDSRHNRVQAIDGRGNVTRYTYDGLSRLTATTRFLSTGGQAITSQSWDDNSRLTGQTDNNTNTTAYLYDALNRQARTVFADGTTNGTIYDVHHNPTTTTDANGSVVNVTFDEGNRPIAKTITPGAGISGPTSETYQYDGLSRTVSAANDDSAVTRSYDSLSHVTTETQQVVPGGPPQTVASAYDAEGNVLACTYPGGRIVNSIYDPLNRLQMVTNSAGLIAAYSYFGPGRVERRDYGNNTRAAFSYDGIRRLTNHTSIIIATGTNIDSRAYAWDAVGNQTAMTDLLAPALDARTFSYDSLNRLTHSATAVVGPTNSYSLDGVGNRLSVTGGSNAGSYTMNSAVPPADSQMNQYSSTPFDARAYDANGNLTNAGPQRFAYDYLNRLVSCTNSTSGVALAFKYDCFGRRIEKSGAATTSRYYYAGWQEIEEQDDTDATVATYAWGNGIDEQLTMDRGGQRYFFHADDLGSIRKVTDDSGNVLEQYRYDDFGEPSFFDGSGSLLAGTQIGNDTLFTGRRYDPETGLYYYRTRYLDPIAGRFTSRDTIGIWTDPAELGNGSTYVGNNPWTVQDPNGTWIYLAPFSYPVTGGSRMMWCRELYSGGFGMECNPMAFSTGSGLTDPGNTRADGVPGFGSYGGFSVSGGDSSGGTRAIRYTVSASPTLSIPGNVIDFSTGGSSGGTRGLTGVIDAIGATRFNGIIVNPQPAWFSGSGNPGGTRTVITTTRSNIKHQSMQRGTEPWCLNHPLECGLWGTGSANGSSGSGIAIKEAGVKFTGYAGIAIKEPGVKFTGYAGIAIKEPGVKFTGYAGIAIKEAGVKFTGYAGLAIKDPGVK